VSYSAANKRSRSPDAGLTANLEAHVAEEPTSTRSMTVIWFPTTRRRRAHVLRKPEHTKDVKFRAAVIKDETVVTAHKNMVGH